MELASQECCLHSVLFTRRYICDLRPSYYHVAISLYSVVVLEKIELDRRSLNRF